MLEKRTNILDQIIIIHRSPLTKIRLGFEGESCRMKKKEKEGENDVAENHKPITNEVEKMTRKTHQQIHEKHNNYKEHFIRKMKHPRFYGPKI